MNKYVHKVTKYFSPRMAHLGTLLLGAAAVIAACQTNDIIKNIANIQKKSDEISSLVLDSKDAVSDLKAAVSEVKVAVGEIKAAVNHLREQLARTNTSEVVHKSTKQTSPSDSDYKKTLKMLRSARPGQFYLPESRVNKAVDILQDKALSDDEKTDAIMRELEIKQ